MFDHCRIQAHRLPAMLDQYRFAVERLRQSPHGMLPPAQAAEENLLAQEAGTTIENSRAALKRQIAEVERVTEPAIAREVLRVATTAGTNGMLVSLTRALGGLWGTQTIQETKRLNLADNLLEAVDITRTGGWLIRDLLDLPETLASNPGAGQRPKPDNEETPLSSRVLARHNKNRVAATGDVAKHVLWIIDRAYVQAGSTPVAVATIGYSSTVLKCLEEARAKIGVVFILQCDEQTREADDLMLAALEDRKIEAAVVALAVGGARDRRVDHVKVALFGFEAVSLDGELAHRNGLQTVLRPIEDFFEHRRKAGPEVQIYAVGESWKVRAFGTLRGGDGKKKVPARLIYGTRAEFSIVTDCPGTGAQMCHSPATDALQCCRIVWTKRLLMDIGEPDVREIRSRVETNDDVVTVLLRQLGGARNRDVVRRALNDLFWLGPQP